MGHVPDEPALLVGVSHRPDVIRLIAAVLPSFSPGTDPLAWPKVAELVRVTGRTTEECAAMGWDEIATVIDVHSKRLQSFLRGRAVTPSAAASLVPPALPESDAEEGRGATTCERLKALWSTADGKAFLLAAKNIKEIAERIGRKPTAVKESAFFKFEIMPKRKVQKSLEKYERDDARERAEKAKAELAAQGGRRKRYRR